MDRAALERLDLLLKPIYQDLDGRSHAEEVDRVAALARRFFDGDEALRGKLELLVRFQAIESWLNRVGSISRAALATGLEERLLHEAAAGLRRIAAPVDAAERATAAALLVDRSGVRALAERFGRARREGQSVAEVARQAAAEQSTPEWLPAEARIILDERRRARDFFCRAILDEIGSAHDE